MDVATVEGVVTIINAVGAAIALIIHAWKARDESNAHAANTARALDLALAQMPTSTAGEETSAQTSPPRPITPAGV